MYFFKINTGFQVMEKDPFVNLQQNVKLLNVYNYKKNALCVIYFTPCYVIILTFYIYII